VVRDHQRNLCGFFLPNFFDPFHKQAGVIISPSLLGKEIIMSNYSNPEKNNVYSGWSFFSIYGKKKTIQEKL
jgi:hypothetical protein|tara:strand:+ start:159 stop:374 length:216 start_codon:yes stop_codon:yes gene_type:complete